METPVNKRDTVNKLQPKFERRIQEFTRLESKVVFMGYPFGNVDVKNITESGSGECYLGRIDRQNSRYRTAKTTISKFSSHASFVELDSAKNALNENVWKIEAQFSGCFGFITENLSSEVSDVLTDDVSDEEVPANNLLEFSLDS
ncbi:hypothetical protein TNCV_2576121 [Trichonephila clavipes]|uniref:Uncharacterized protein n=1 Tax=Trichonephila clavipes TaxID=2585209 RepID=A0A8X6REF6_TRICX|nr:hypothetical protein TNCV_2576121 [Trichonephila clavipes]